MENNNILQKLDGLEARYEEVTTLITDPSVIADQQRFVKLTREYASYEGDTLEKVVNARKITASASPTVDEINKNEEALNAVSAKLIAVAEQYPDLKANDQYKKTMDEITRYEENVRLSRMTFNDTVTKFNQQVRMFPGSLVASLLHFTPKEYLADEPKKADYPVI